MSEEQLRVGDFIGTHTGRFWPMDPREEDMSIEDIAHALSMQCRYLGHVIRFYCTAEHTCHLVDYFIEDGEIELARWALLHDAPEAYLVDVPRPIKDYLPGYREMDFAVMVKVASRFGLVGAEKITIANPMPQRVKVADSRMINNEKENHRNPQFVVVADQRPLPRVILQYWDPTRAEQEFLKRFDNLFPGQRQKIL